MVWGGTGDLGAGSVMARRVVSSVILVILLFAGVQSVAAEPVGVARGAVATGVYNHPIRNYTLVFPQDFVVTEKGQRANLNIRSPKGFVVDIQTGDTSPHVDLPGMLGRLEAAYLGPQKPWNTKIGEGVVAVGGLPAREGVYAGRDNRARIVIARGAKTDFVFMFFARNEDFDVLEQEFAELISSFRPSPEETALQSAAAGVPPSGETPVPLRLPPVPDQDTRRFVGKRLGYAISYPGTWDMVRSGPFAVVLGGREGTPAFDLTVSIQNVQPRSVINPGQVVEAVYASLNTQLSAAAFETAYFGESQYIYDRGGVRAVGKQFLVSYTDGKTRYRQLSVVLPRPGSTVAHVWSYRAPQERFYSYWPIVENMLGSWTLLDSSESVTRDDVNKTP